MYERVRRPVGLTDMQEYEVPEPEGPPALPVRLPFEVDDDILCRTGVLLLSPEIVLVLLMQSPAEATIPCNENAKHMYACQEGQSPGSGPCTCNRLAGTQFTSRPATRAS